MPATTRNRTQTLSGADPDVGATLTSVLVIGTHVGNLRRQRAEVELDELEELARTLNATVVERRLVNLREHPHPATFLRSGTVTAIGDRLAELGRPAVLVNDALTPRQQRNLQEAWQVPVLDRTEVILAIFARRASTAEGRIQVEMAQLEHLLPRLAGGWRHLERQRGGVGLRGGPGETQIEVDRRLIGQRLKRLRQRLQEMERRRGVQRSARQDVPLAGVALVGYTNAGKSTLLNALTSSTVLADNLLFATLDPTSRVHSLPSARRVILTDTVGFIQNLPTELVEAFAATLEEVRQAHVLAVVVDGSHPDAEHQLSTVLETLESMDCRQPAILVMSKVDRLDANQRALALGRLADIGETTPLMVSSTTGEGIRELRAAIDGLAATVVPDTRANLPTIGTAAQPSSNGA
ncbi:MAG TPA: GTPase HflX [Candidatus Dormibacteraeota bacterium]|nr:GTPase HflX [Candidatus Dormibacteraeota bacterium]